MAAPTQKQVGDALTRLGHYRVTRAQQAAGEGDPDGVSGALLLALGLRETWGANVEGGAKQVGGRWEPEDDPGRMDVGVFQISRRYHHDALAWMPGVKAGTWAPVIPGRTAADGGHCPRFEESLQYVLREFHDTIAIAEDHKVPVEGRPRFAVVAHNAGVGGALDGWRSGNWDRDTAGGDYSAWVLAARTEVNRWLREHPNWRA